MCFALVAIRRSNLNTFYEIKVDKIIIGLCSLVKLNYEIVCNE